MEDTSKGAGANQGREDFIRDAVRSRYADIARSGREAAAGCCGGDSSCCGSPPPGAVDGGDDPSRALGYTKDELAAAPQGANLGLGCGNPQAFAEIELGEVVLDLGSGAGFDCFLASRAVGMGGLVIGVDMTPEMVGLARDNARRAGCENVEFRLGEIEHLPVADESVDVIISNCVISLSVDKPAAFAEAFRVLKPGGRLAVSDVVATAELPAEWKDDMSKLPARVSGAAKVDELEAMLKEAGFVDVQVEPKEGSREFIREWEPGTKLEDYVLSARIAARKSAL